MKTTILSATLRSQWLASTMMWPAVRRGWRDVSSLLYRCGCYSIFFQGWILLYYQINTKCSQSLDLNGASCPLVVKYENTLQTLYCKFKFENYWHFLHICVLLQEWMATISDSFYQAPILWQSLPWVTSFPPAQSQWDQPRPYRCVWGISDCISLFSWLLISLTSLLFWMLAGSS